MAEVRVGELFAGVGGLSLALERVGIKTAWFAENDPAAASVLARHWPAVPNLGDVTAIDWEEVPRVDIIAGGSPCQDFSYAGRGAGLNGSRSGLYWHLWDAVRILRPRYVVLENVAAVLVRGGPVIVGSLAGLGYDCRWGIVRASDAGAPHRRARWFCFATDNAGPGRRQARNAFGRDSDGATLGGSAGTPEHGGRHRAPADTGGVQPERWGGPGTVDGTLAAPRREGRQPDKSGHATSCSGGAPTDTDGGRCQGGWSEGSTQPENSSATWGDYWPAIARWEHILGEPAPHPLDGRRLNPELPRWMMGLPAGWLDGMTRAQKLRAAGNAVCPQQAALALELLGLP